MPIIITAVKHPFSCNTGFDVRIIYEKVLGAAGHRHAKGYLAAVAFTESSFFPIPPDVMVIPMVLSKPADWWRIALICTIFSVFGGVTAYFIGAYLFDTVGKALIEFYAYQDRLPDFVGMYNNWGGWVVFIAGLTPFPYKVITLASGMTKLNLAIFVSLSILSRGLRFFLVSGLLYYFGDRIRGLLERYFGLISILVVGILLLGFFGIKLFL